MQRDSNADSDPGDHRFNPQTASPALKTAMADLAERTGRDDSDFADITLAEAYNLAAATYADGLPEFWRVWQSWNASSFDPPAEMGDL